MINTMNLKNTRTFVTALAGAGTLALASAGPAYAVTTIIESGDFGGTNADRTLSTNIGTLTDSQVIVVGTIEGLDDRVDAWTFTVPTGQTLTAINVTESGFDGVSDYLDLYSSTTADPGIVGGDVLSQPLTVGNHSSLLIGPGTYKLTTSSQQTGSYSIEIVSTVPEPTSLALLGLGGLLLHRRRR